MSTDDTAAPTKTPRRRAQPAAPGPSRPVVWALRASAIGVLSLGVVASFSSHDATPKTVPSAETSHVKFLPVSPTPTAATAPSVPVASIYTLPASPAIPTPPPLTGYSILINQPGTTVTGKCSTGTAVQITASKANVTLTGHCTSVLITADGVSLNVDQFDFGYVSGAGNVIRYGAGTPTVSDYGSGTSVAKR